MILSFWRKTHLVLALFSFLFLLITSITGVILSLEPISDELSPYHIKNISEVSLAETLSHLEGKYDELIEFNIENDEFIQASAINQKGDFQQFYLDPRTGEPLGDIGAPSPIFEFTRTLHRSLFMGTLGRICVGITAFLLLLISISGIALIIKRQLKIQRFFGKITRGNFYQYWHLYFGRIFLFSILLIAITGTYLSLQRFDLLPKEEIQEHTVDFETLTNTPLIQWTDFNAFEAIKLSEIVSVQFPFSDYVEDYFEIELIEKSVIVNQFNGQIISEIPKGNLKAAEIWSFNLHTGKGNIIWAIILLLSAISILFFIFSGFKMTLQRRKSKKKNPFKKNQCSIVILVGSENGSTLLFAKAFQEALLSAGKKVYLDELNNYDVYKKMEQLVIFTSTYGTGSAPSNAKKFLDKFRTIEQRNPFQFSVVGFGSTNYLLFCEYAKEVQRTLEIESHEFLPLTTINKQDSIELAKWTTNWNLKMNIQAETTIETSEKQKEKELSTFTVVNKTLPTETTHQTFSLELANDTIHAKSGDLIAFKHEVNAAERLYSIGKSINGNLLLSIRKHSRGKCSTFLSELRPNTSIPARIQSNSSFHFPKKAKKVIGVANGTGITPFLGMAFENIAKTDFHLYWGGKSKKVWEIYQAETEQLTLSGNFKEVKTVFSAEESRSKQYVQDQLKIDREFIGQSLKSGSIFMICGSLKMS